MRLGDALRPSMDPCGLGGALAWVFSPEDPGVALWPRSSRLSSQNAPGCRDLSGLAITAAVTVPFASFVGIVTVDTVPDLVDNCVSGLSCCWTSLRDEATPTDSLRQLSCAIVGCLVEKRGREKEEQILPNSFLLVEVVILKAWLRGKSRG